MKYLLDMVHHNPGEARFTSRFLDPGHLVDYGFNGQVFKHIHCAATFAASGVDCFPAHSPDEKWLESFTTDIEQEIAAAKRKNLLVFHHIDLFVLPARLVDHFRDEICDPVSGRILASRPKTLELHRILFDELTLRFPDVDGYIVRVGETYLHDAPYHMGNGPIQPEGPPWTPEYLYQETLAGTEKGDAWWNPSQVQGYVDLISFLREELCVKHGKQLLFRTWDIFPDKLHARAEHYLQVTSAIEPHSKLAFSIKHTALDFWRHVKVNESLTLGAHPQVIEVQCQREYEGKGAYPNYVMGGVIDGFEENEVKTGLRDLIGHPSIIGIYSWSRGGGWYGPYIQNELWPDLNAFVLARFARDPLIDEREIVTTYARARLGLRGKDPAKFHELCVLSSRAVLKGRHCQPFDRYLKGSVLPTACWMRDDRLGGHRQLAVVLSKLAEDGTLAEALLEKQEAVCLWERVVGLGNEIEWPEGPDGEFVKVSAEYGRMLFDIVHQGWRILVAGAVGDACGRYDEDEISDAIRRYDRAWDDYRMLEEKPGCPTLYVGSYFNLPGTPPVGGLDESVDYYRNRMRQSHDN